MAKENDVASEYDYNRREAIRTGTTELVMYVREGLLLIADEKLVYSVIESLTE